MTNKYRIFDKQEQEYLEEPDYRWMLSRSGKLYNSENDEWHTIGDRYIVEFSTGLFDANKTEIFEGDKFPAEENDGGFYLIEWSDKLSKFSVNQYGHTMYFNEGSGEEFDNEITRIDKNVFDVSDIANFGDVIIGNINME